MFHKQKILRTLIIYLVGIFFIAGCSGFQSQATPTATPLEIEDINPMVSATGVIVPVEWARLSMSTPGKIEEILAEEGDQVNEGDVLVRLRGKEDLTAAVAAANTEVIAAQNALDDLYDNVDSAKTKALETISLAEKNVRDAQYQLDNFTVPHDQADLEAMEAVDVMKERLDAAREAFKPYKYFSSGNETREDLKEEMDEAQADYNAAIKRLEYEIELQVAKEELEEAKEDNEILAQGPDPSDITLAEARLENAEAAFEAAQAALEDLELLAPFDGTVSELNIHLGEWVTPGTPVILIADLENLRIETTDLNEIDAARVNVKNPASITFDALPDVVINGEVERIAPKASEGSGVNYTAVIIMPDWPAELRWGMTAFVDIEVAE